MQVYDDTICILGEGPLWHPGRGELFWFDILGRRLHRKGQHWQFDECVSAAGWVDDDTLLIATQTALLRFTISTGRSHLVAPLEADNPATRSNDGRADPFGGFWIGTMAISGEVGGGAIYRFYRGEVTTVATAVTCPNAICFSPDRTWAYYTDTGSRQILRVALNETDGAPMGQPQVHVDMTGTEHAADGAVVAADGTLWTAQWGSSRVAGYDREGRFLRAFEVPALQSSCPAFGGPTLSTLYVTSAAIGLPDVAFTGDQRHGQTFMLETDVIGQPEHRVIL